MSFQDLRLIKPIVCAVMAEGYTDPTPIQAKAIPEALDGQDILGCAQTGTGKTCAFALPILQRLTEQDAKMAKPSRKANQGRPPRALVLCPTRELATQIYESFVTYGTNLPLRHTVVYGGVRQGKQVRALRAGIDVLVATPGRLLDLVNQGFIDLRQIEVLVLDEADRMLDMGFINDIRKIVKMMPDKRQTLFFSATISKEIRRLSDSILRNPVVLETNPESSTVDTIAQKVYMVERQHKPQLLERLLLQDSAGRVLVFTRTKHGADKLVKSLRQSAIDAEAIHGNKTQNARTRTMNRFKSGATQILVATDVASRGIDVDDITHVVNYDMPIDPETYVHRIGRTARAGASGIAVSYCDRDEMRTLQAIERRARIEIEVADDEPDITFEKPRTSHRGKSAHYGPRNKKHHDPKKKSNWRFEKRNSPGGKSRKPKAENRKSSSRTDDQSYESMLGKTDHPKPKDGTFQNKRKNAASSNGDSRSDGSSSASPSKGKGKTKRKGKNARNRDSGGGYKSGSSNTGSQNGRASGSSPKAGAGKPSEGANDQRKSTGGKNKVNRKTTNAAGKAGARSSRNSGGGSGSSNGNSGSRNNSGGGGGGKPKFKGHRKGKSMNAGRGLSKKSRRA